VRAGRGRHGRPRPRAHVRPGGGLTPERVVVLLALTALVSGGLQVLYGALGGGTLIKYIPYPVVTGTSAASAS